MSEPESTPEAEAALERARQWGIHCIAVPTPFAVGRINCYLLEGDPLTLVDAGPRSDHSMEVLEDGLKQAGYRTEDLELIVATHQHIDHIGQIADLVALSGAEVAALDLAVKRLAAFTDGSDDDDGIAVELMIRHGIPTDIAEGLREVSASFRDWGAPVEVTVPLAADSRFVMGSREYEVLHRPGHSPSDTLFWDAERGLAFGGDHLLSHISSNPLISKPLTGSEERTHALIDYDASLRLTREMPIDLMLTGHGLPVTEHVDLIDRRLASQERRTGKILELLGPEGRSAHSIADGIWGNIALTQAYLTLSEVIGHLDILIERGQAREVTDGDRTLFEAIG